MLPPARLSGRQQLQQPIVRRAVQIRPRAEVDFSAVANADQVFAERRPQRAADEVRASLEDHLWVDLVEEPAVDGPDSCDLGRYVQVNELRLEVGQDQRRVKRR